MRNWMMCRRFLIHMALAATVGLSAGAGWGDAPSFFNYQGKLAGSDGTPVTAPVSMEFRVYAAPGPGGPAPLTTYTPTGPVAVTNGVFNVLVGDVAAGTISGQPLVSSLSSSAARYLEVVVNGTALSPRQRLAAVPYAMGVAGDAIGTIQIVDGGVADVDISSVSWSKLFGVPGGFADGQDNGETSWLDGGTPVATTSTVNFSGPQFTATAGAGRLDLSLNASSVTLMGNAFNGSGQLLRLPGSGADLAVASVSASSVSASGFLQLPSAAMTGAAGRIRYSAGALQYSTGTAAAEVATVQNRVTGNCSGSAMVGINANGTVSCGTDLPRFGGNSLSAPAILGTNDAQPLAFETNGVERVSILGSGPGAGNIGVGQAANQGLAFGLTKSFPPGLPGFPTGMMLDIFSPGSLVQAFEAKVSGGVNGAVVGITGSATSNGVGSATGIQGSAFGPGTNYAVAGSAGGGTNYAGYFNGDVTVTGMFSNPSDRRLKKNILPIESPLERLLNLRGVTFEWIDPERYGGHPGPRMGMIAQEIEKVFPSWVKTGPGGIKEVAYVGFEGLAVEAIRALKAENDDLKRRLDDLESRLSRLEGAP
jgi:hypothetical protein